MCNIIRIDFRFHLLDITRYNYWFLVIASQTSAVVLPECVIRKQSGIGQQIRLNSDCVSSIKRKCFRDDIVNVLSSPPTKTWTDSEWR